MLFLRSLATNKMRLSSNAVLVLFLRSLASNEVCLCSNAVLVLFLRNLVLLTDYRRIFLAENIVF